MQSTTTVSIQKKTGNSRLSSTQRNGKNLNSTSRAKGKSKYAQKSRKPKPPVVAKRKDPVLSYTSVCCGLPAVKKACVAVGKKDALVQSLGKFRCTGCKKRAKVTVSKYKAPEPVKAGEYTAASIKVLEGMAPAVKDNPYITDPDIIARMEALPKAEVPIA